MARRWQESKERDRCEVSCLRSPRARVYDRMYSNALWLISLLCVICFAFSFVEYASLPTAYRVTLWCRKSGFQNSNTLRARARLIGYCRAVKRAYKSVAVADSKSLDVYSPSSLSSLFLFWLDHLKRVTEYNSFGVCVECTYETVFIGWCLDVLSVRVFYFFSQFTWVDLICDKTLRRRRFWSRR